MVSIDIIYVETVLYITKRYNKSDDNETNPKNVRTLEVLEKG